MRDVSRLSQGPYCQSNSRAVNREGCGTASLSSVFQPWQRSAFVSSHYLGPDQNPTIEMNVRQTGGYEEQPLSCPIPYA